ncbi:MAG: DUF4982 domain-containing protein [Kiritimatiellae bacterium]|nr:DUF4982 domain-containing protein [Kiritimatiellia bacterium]
MKKTLVAGLLFCATLGAWSFEADVPLGGEGWRFAKDPSCTLKAEAPNFDDTGWEAVRVPHDWAISGPFDPKAHGGTGKLPWRGVGWYRKTFELKDIGFKLDANGRRVPTDCVFLDFDGVMAAPKVYVNGHFAGGWDYGYASFRVDATPFVKVGERNVVAVRCDTRDHRSRWYPGAGLYRRVTLRVRAAAHFAYHGVFVTTPQVTSDAATVRVAWETEGALPSDAKVRLLVGRDGRQLDFVAEAAAVAGAATFSLVRPALWDVDSPNLYNLQVVLCEGSGRELSRETCRFGVRTIAYPTPTAEPAKSDWAANGFHLNGRRVQMKGVDLHSDLGLLGMAFDKSAMRRQLQIMKDMGANALRTSHNCPAPEVLDLCDEMGILVWDECFDKWEGTAGRRSDQNLEMYVARNLQAFVKRDRNHPCVVAWSMSNEIAGTVGRGASRDGLSRERCRFFRDLMRQMDATRPVGNGNIYFLSHDEPMKAEIFADLDITGWNYMACYRPAKARYPHQAIVYTESASAHSSYGYYPETLPLGKRDHVPGEYQCSGYDFNAGPDIADWEFDRMEKDIYVCGEFVWTGIDYLGEPSPFNREARSSYFGIVDLTGVPKDRYYLYRSQWNKTAETCHLVPHWTWPKRASKTVPVFVYTSGDSAELFVNGKSMGVRRKGEGLFKNLFADAKVTVSSEETSRGNLAGHLLDGDPMTRWCAATNHLPEAVTLERAQPVRFKYVDIEFENAYAQYAYQLDASEDGVSWRKIFEKPIASEARPEFAQEVSAKALRLTVTGVKGGWPSIREVVVREQKKPLPDYYDICYKYRLMWFDVPYEPGELKAVCSRDGRVIDEARVCTAEKPVRLAAVQERRLTNDPEELLWVQVDALDAKGVRNPWANDRVQFRLDGPGRILGVGNGNAHEFEAFTKTDSHPMFYGKVTAVIRRTSPGELKLTVSAPGLAPDTIVLK